MFAMKNTNTDTLIYSTLWRDYYELTKPRVVFLILITAVVGMCLATPNAPDLSIIFYGITGIGLSAASAAAINQLVDRRADAMMARTHNRPIPKGRIAPLKAFSFAILLGIAGLAILTILVNPLTAVLTFFSLIGYACIYTMYLKRATPQNIVIGGLAGAAPPLLGWTAVTGTFDPNALLLVLIIYTWTPPHFWALAIHRKEDYAKANIPMLPVTHGDEFTKLLVLLYTILLSVITPLPYVVHMSGIFYLITSTLLNVGFLYYAVLLKMTDRPLIAINTFKYSISYLFLLFAVLLVDHYFLGSFF
jgi:protoheme IX farnesyltransferase